jgi:hypothetical protein
LLVINGKDLHADFLSVNVDAAAASILIAVHAVGRKIKDEQL